MAESMPRGGDEDVALLLDRHVAWSLGVASGLPEGAAAQESSRLPLAYFALAGLRLLRAHRRIDTEQVVEWVYSLQVVPREGDGDANSGYGFRGSPSAGSPYIPNGSYPTNYEGSHIAMTYTALAILRILGDDFARVNKKAIVQTLRRLQRPDGSFMPIVEGAESDMRFVFCAAAISSMLGDWNGIDIERAVAFIRSSQSYDFGFGLNPGLESHGGATYCAVAALQLFGRLREEEWLDTSSLIEWCVQRQEAPSGGGFQGRTNKVADTCYAFWVGGTLQMMGAFHLADVAALRRSLLACQCPVGPKTL